MYDKFASNMADKLSAQTTAAQNLRDHMRAFLDQIEGPNHYTGQDFDRAQAFATWLTCLGTNR